MPGPAVEGSPFTPEQLQYWLEHPGDSLVPNIIVCCSITAFFSILFVALRFFSRRLPSGRYKFHSSDWLILVALFFFLVSDVCFAMLTPYGGGRHVIYINNPYMLQVFSVLSEATYGLSMGFLKFSILSLYGSIFHQSQTFRYWLWGVGVFIAGWALTSSLGAILQCVPIAKAYDNSLNGYCIHYGQLSLVVGICNVVTDFVIILLPVPIVAKMHVNAKKKAIIITIFAAGCTAVVVSIVRLAYSLDVGSVDGSWTAIPAGYSACVELAVGFLVVSIPAYRNFYRKTFKPEEKSTAWSNGNSNKSDNVALHYKTPYGKASLADSASKGSYWTSSKSSSYSETTDHTVTVASNGEAMPGAPSGIHVTDRVELSTVPRPNNEGTWVQLPENDASGAWRAV